MRIVYGKNLSVNELNIVDDISKNCGILFDTARLLFYRDIDSVDKAKKYLYPSKKNFIDSFLFKDMKASVQRIYQARDLGETILVYGDYDADGICATTILTKALEEFGVNVISTIPEREEGYGINLERIENLSNENLIDLIITVDCGISEKENIDELIDLGVDVIVTDHHEPPEELPNTLIINPKVKGETYPFNGLCGAGVSYKLAYALIGEKANKYLDLVALATIADSMDLINENRDLVYEGIKLLNGPNHRSAFKYLINDNVKQITSQVLAYTIAPRINAGGRMGDAECALKMFLTDNENEIFDYAVKLNEYNLQRQVECDKLYKQAKEQIEKEKIYNNNAIIIGSADWKTGYTGIVAARLVEEYGKPTIVFAGYEEDFKGSARSIPGINIHDAIGRVSDCLLVYGGHSQAAGVTVSKDCFNEFIIRLNQTLSEDFKNVSSEKTIYADWLIQKPISITFAQEIERMEPFGVGNKKPTFVLETRKTEVKKLKANSPHYSYNTEYVEMLNFNGEKDVFDLSLPTTKQIIFETNFSVFRDRRSVKGIIKKVIVDYNSVTHFNERLFRNELRSFINNPINLLSINFENLTVDRSVFEMVFGYLSSLVNTPFLGSIEHYEKGNELPVNLKQFIFCVEVFLELEFFSIDDGKLVKNPMIRRPLTNSKIYSKISLEID